MAAIIIDVEAIIDKVGIENRDATRDYLESILANSDDWTEYEIYQLAMAFDEGYSAALKIP